MRNDFYRECSKVSALIRVGLLQPLVQVMKMTCIFTQSSLKANICDPFKELNTNNGLMSLIESIQTCSDEDRNSTHVKTYLLMSVIWSSHGGFITRFATLVHCPGLFSVCVYVCLQSIFTHLHDCAVLDRKTLCMYLMSEGLFASTFSAFARCPHSDCHNVT